VTQSKSLPGIVLKEETFKRILEHLAGRFKVLSLAEFLAVAPGNAEQRRCLLTFDDGWEDNYTTAYPLLQRFRMPATILATTGWIGNNGGSWVEQLRHALAEPALRQSIEARFKDAPSDSTALGSDERVIEYLKHKPAAERERILKSWLPSEPVPQGNGSYERMLSWQQVRDMSSHGVEFGAHTVTHPLLPYEEDAVVERELTQSKQALEKALGTKVRAFAYPNGDWDERVRSWVQRTGYECAFTTQRGWHRVGADLFTIRRVLLHEGNVTGLDGRFSPAAFAFTLARGH
jgi:peptidoglycan/xylan/chitin deacetylase (PgdA/CDA1 family)